MNTSPAAQPESFADNSGAVSLSSSQSAARPAMNLLVVSSDTYPPTRVDVSVLFGEELAGRGHRIDWLLQSEKACERAYEAQWGGGMVLVGPTDLGDSLLHRVRKHLRGIAHDLKLFRLLKTDTYDAVEVKDKFVSGLFALLAAKLYGKRFIFWLSYPFAEEYVLRARDGTGRYPLLYWIRGAAFRVLLYRILLPRADHVFVQSDQMKKNVADEGIALEMMTPVPMGIRLASMVTPVVDAERTLLPRGELSIMYLGTLTKVRRLDFLVRVLEKVRAQVSNAKLYIIGRGDSPDDEALIINEANRLGLSDAVVLVGLLPQAQALKYVAEADVCVSPLFPNPILNAGTPTKVVEYMAAGKPIVANDHPDQRLLLDASGAGICVPYDEAAFAAAIVRLLKSPAEARLMGARGRPYVAEHRSYKTIADIVERDLLRVIGKNPNG